MISWLWLPVVFAATMAYFVLAAGRNERRWKAELVRAEDKYRRVLATHEQTIDGQRTELVHAEAILRQTIAARDELRDQLEAKVLFRAEKRVGRHQLVQAYAAEDLMRATLDEAVGELVERLTKHLKVLRYTDEMSDAEVFVARVLLKDVLDDEPDAAA